MSYVANACVTHALIKEDVVVLRILFGVIFLAMTAGCATTRAKTDTEQLQSRVTELEKKIEEKDSEIVDLQYQVKDLSSKVADNKDFPSSDANFSIFFHSLGL